MKNAKINNKNLVATSIATAILVITGSTPVIGAANINTVTPAPNNDATTATEATTAPPNNGATTTTETATPDPNTVNNEEVLIACPWWPWC